MTPPRYFAISSSPWNTPLPADAPVRADSSTLVTDLNRMVTTGPWWINRETYSVPIYEVTNATATVAVTLYQSNGTTLISPAQNGNAFNELAYRLSLGVPIPSGATAAAGSDKHMTIVNTDTGAMWDFWDMRYGDRVAGHWACSSAAWIPNHTVNVGLFVNGASPYQSTLWGANATNLPMVAGLILDSEFQAGVIPHALQVALLDPKNTFVWPATATDGDSGKVIPEGSLFRIKRSVNVNSYSAANGTATTTLRMIAKAMQDYGVIVNDRTADGADLRAEASGTYAYGEYPDSMLANIPITDFEFIDTDIYRPPVVATPVIAATGQYIGMLG